MTSSNFGKRHRDIIRAGLATQDKKRDPLSEMRASYASRMGRSSVASKVSTLNKLNKIVKEKSLSDKTERTDALNPWPDSTDKLEPLGEIKNEVYQGRVPQIRMFPKGNLTARKKSEKKITARVQPVRTQRSPVARKTKIFTNMSPPKESIKERLQVKRKSLPRKKVTFNSYSPVA